MSFDIFTLLEMYQQHPCLWDKSCLDYKNRQIRDLAEAKILLSFTGSELNNIKTLRKKIRSIRGTFNIEFRKVRQSKKTGSGSSEIYVPKLRWYEYAATFLSKNQDSEPESESNLVLHEDDDASKENDPQLFNTNGKEIIFEEATFPAASGSQTQQMFFSPTCSTSGSFQAQSSEKTNNNTPKFRGRKNSGDDMSLKEAVHTLKEVRRRVMDDEFAAFGQHLAIQMNKLPLNVALHLQKQIQELVTEARINAIGHCITPPLARSASPIASMSRRSASPIASPTRSKCRAGASPRNTPDKTSSQEELENHYLGEFYASWNCDT